MQKTDSVPDLLLPRLLRIPDYQRGYAWERDQVQDFLDDLSLLEMGQRHYTGTVVLLPSIEHIIDDDAQVLLLADVVDGQQRLTTVCLLLNALRRVLEQRGDADVAAGLRRQFLLVRLEGVPTPKLRVAPEAQPLWSALLTDARLPQVETLSTRRLADAALQIQQHVAEIADSVNGEQELRRLRDGVLRSLQFTVYQLDRAADVGVIFETLNDRGKPLTELEKVKNYLLFLTSRLPDGRQEALAARVNSAWSQVYRLLLEVARVSPAGEDQFLRAHWLAAQNPVPRSWAGTKSIKERFPRERYVGESGLDALMEEVGEYVDSLARAAEAFADSLRPDSTSFSSFPHAAAQRAQVLHEKLRRTGTVAVFQPLAIALRERHPEDGAGYIEVLDLALRFAVRVYLIGGYRADAAQTRLYRIANDVWCGKRDVSDALRALRALVAEYADDHYVDSVLRDVDDNWYRWGGLKFFLYEYEESLTRGAEPATEYVYFEKALRQRTIEHILPQKATSEYWTDRFDDEQLRRYTHSLGNLVLTVDNSAYSNKDFPEKRGAAGPGEPRRACYAQANLRQEQELAPIAHWSPREIEDRQARLARWALQHWSVDLTDVEPPAVDREQDEEPDELRGDAMPPMVLNEELDR